MKRIIISHPTGNQTTKNTIYGLYKYNLLESFHTCIGCFKNNIYYYLSYIYPPIKRRSYNSIIKNRTFQYPLLELCRMFSSKFKFNYLTRHEKGLFCIDKIYQNLDSKVAQYIQNINSCCGGVYAYEDGALNSFINAKRKRLICFYDLPIGYWRAMRILLQIEKEKNPDWAITIETFNDSHNKLTRKDKELELADVIFVASTFTKKTLEYYPKKKLNIRVIPYGFPPVNKNREYKSFKNRKIRILFVGGLSQRKGISYLFESVKGLEDHIELTIIGQGNLNICPVLKNEIEKVNYIPSLPHQEILMAMANHDILIFPSLFEGFGLVITEAMSQGTPVITTERTCGPNFIIHGENGWIVEAGQSKSIHKLLLDIINNPEILHKVGKAAMQTAEKRPWECYEKELMHSIQETINHTNRTCK